MCVASGRGHHRRAKRLRRKRYRRKTVESTVLCIKRAISSRGLCIATSRCCLLRPCSCCSLESLCALLLSAQELDFIVELLSGAVSRGTCRQVVVDRGKSRPLGSEFPVASSLSELLLIRVTTLVGFERRAFIAVESRSRNCHRVVLQLRELIFLGSSKTRV